MSCRKHPESSSCPRLTSPNLKFCPECGVGPASISVEMQQNFSVPEDQVKVVHIPIEHYGRGPVIIWASILDADEGVRLLHDKMTIERKSCLDLEFPASAKNKILGCTLVISSDDGSRCGDDFWKLNPTRKQEIAINTVVVDRPHVELLPQISAICPIKRSRTLELRNRGSLPISVNRIRCSPGLKIDPQPDANISLLPKSGLPINLVANQIFVGEGSVEVLDEGDRIVASTKVILKSKPSVRLITRYTIGIDFGTNGTSIFVRDEEAKSTYPLKEVYKDSNGIQVIGDIRFPTYIYCKSGNRLTDWYYGTRAVSEFKSSTHGEGVWITELKTKLREDNPISYRIGDKDVSPVELTAWYFERLLNDLILPCIKKDIDQGDKALFIFSLPVLDQDVRFDLQKSNTLAAVSKAGYENYGLVDIALEPECAALTIVDRIKRGVLDGQLHDGNRILVFDSGGGTTDLYIGTLSIRGGEPITFRDPVLDSAERGENESWGGREITYHLGKGLALQPKLNILKRCVDFEYPGTAFIDNPINKKYDFSQFEGSKATNTEFVEEQKWTNKFPKFTLKLDDVKIQVSQDPENPKKMIDANKLLDFEALLLDIKRVTNCAAASAEPIIGRVADLLKSTAGLQQDSHAGQIKHNASGNNGSLRNIDAIFPVGGNCNLRAVQDLLKETFPYKVVLLEDEDLKMMVPEGTVLSPEHTKTDLPYEIRIQALGDGGCVVDAKVFQANGVGKIVPQKMIFDLPSKEAVFLEVLLLWNDELAKAAVLSVVNTSNDLQRAVIRFSLEEGWLIIKWTVGEDSFNRRLYEI